MKKGSCCNDISQNQPFITIGIDFGTTNCLIAYYNDRENLEFFKNEIDHSHLFPSIVTIKNNDYMFGCAQLNDCNQIDRKLRIVKSIKRIIGLNLTQIKAIAHELPYEIDYQNSQESEVKIFIGDSSQSVKEVVYGMMIGLVNIIRKQFPKKIIQAVITVPAYFDEKARQIIKEAALRAGINVIRLINEPTAAAIAYINQFKSEINESANYLVYDLGGGTFDISILKQHTKNFFRVLAIGGNKYLGGDDIDLALLQFIFAKANQKLDLQNLNHQEKSNLINAAKKFKELFVDRDESSFIFNEINVKITKDEFENIIIQTIQPSFEIMQKTMQQAKLSKDDLTSIILVGGSTRLSLVKKQIQTIFPGVDILDYLNPDEVVAMGAISHAHSLINPHIDNHMLIDATSFSLGIEVGNGAVEQIIPRNSPIPISNKQSFTTQIDNQSRIKINVCQGESEKFTDNICIGEFSLINLPLMPALIPQIEVTFNIDADGILTVIASSKEDRNISVAYHPTI